MFQKDRGSSEGSGSIWKHDQGDLMVIKIQPWGNVNLLVIASCFHPILDCMLILRILGLSRPIFVPTLLFQWLRTSVSLAG